MAVQRGDQHADPRLGPVVRSLLELQVAMGLGALLCLLVGRALRAASIAASDYQPGTAAFFIGDVFFLTVPVVTWMLLRGRGWRDSGGLAIAMVAPVAAIVVLGEVTRSAYLLWLVTAMYPAMSVGMLAYVLVGKTMFDAPTYAGGGGRGRPATVYGPDDPRARKRRR